MIAQRISHRRGLKASKRREVVRVRKLQHAYDLAHGKVQLTPSFNLITNGKKLWNHLSKSLKSWKPSMGNS